jgi:short-subunit dehydrogenase
LTQTPVLRPPSSPVALVTGASSGIGWAAALALARAGYRVALTARRLDRLDRLAAEIAAGGGEALPLPADLTREPERERLVAETLRHFGRIDVLVNNAGFGWVGRTAEIPWDLARRMLTVNIEAVVHLSRLVLPQMVARRSGHIINLSSVAGTVVLPPEMLYSATRAFVQAFSHGLYRELKGTGVHVSVINPGPVRTEFVQVALGIAPGERPDVEHGVTAETVARAVIALLHRPRKTVWIPGIFAVVPLGALLLGWAVDQFAGPFVERRLRSMERDRSAVATPSPGR